MDFVYLARNMLRKDFIVLNEDWATSAFCRVVHSYEYQHSWKLGGREYGACRLL